nr:Ras-related protein RABA1f-like [Tanacetum cinerariifolium]
YEVRTKLFSNRGKVTTLPQSITRYRAITSAYYRGATVALEALNVETTFTEVLTRIYHMVSRKALDAGNDSLALPKGQTINVGSKDDVFALKKATCCSA